MSITERIAKWREMPVLPIQYKSSLSPYKENTQIRWHMSEAAALRDRLLDTASVLFAVVVVMEAETNKRLCSSVFIQSAITARAILVRLKKEGLVGAQEDKT